MRNERGFTLIELLVVIVILGILAAVVVFAVGGLTDKGEKSACQTDTKTLRTAQEAYYSQATAGNGTYAANAAAIQAKDLLANAPKYHDTAVSGTSYVIYVTNAKCGTANTAASGPPDAASIVNSANPGNS
jgi:general secretion pathway protein G